MTLTKTADCPLFWCLENHAGDRDPDDGVLHYGRRSSIESYEGDDITVVPYRFDGDGERPSCVEVGANSCGRSQVDLTPSSAVLFSKAITAATDGHLTDAVTVPSQMDPDGRYAQVLPDVEIVRIGEHAYRLVKLAFFDASDSPDPVVVQASDADAAYYARCILAVATEVTR